MESKDKNNNKNNETEDVLDKNTGADKQPSSPRYAAYELFGEMRSSTEEENRLFSEMIQRIGTPVGINLIDLSEDDVETLKSGKPIAIGRFENKMQAQGFEENIAHQEIVESNASINGIPLRQKTKYIFSDNGNICQIVSPDFEQMREQRDAAMSEEEQDELAQRQASGETALIIPFDVAASVHARRRFVALSPEILQAEIERAQREILEMEIAQAVMRELGTSVSGDDMSPELAELLDELDDENDCEENTDDDDNDNENNESDE